MKPETRSKAWESGFKGGMETVRDFARAYEVSIVAARTEVRRWFRNTGETPTENLVCSLGHTPALAAVLGVSMRVVRAASVWPSERSPWHAAMTDYDRGFKAGMLASVAKRRKA